MSRLIASTASSSAFWTSPPSRIFRLEFKDHHPVVIAYDGQAVEPHPPVDGRVLIGPAMRIDLLIDMIGPPGTTAPIVDSFYEGLVFTLANLAYSEEASPKSALRAR